MTIPTVTTCEIKVQQYSVKENTVLCNIFFNDVQLYKGIQNKNYPIPYGRYRAEVIKLNHPHERILLLNIPHHSGVELHEANLATQLDGCTAVGELIEGQVLLHSVYTLNELVRKVKQYNVCYVTLTATDEVKQSGLLNTAQV